MSESTAIAQVKRGRFAVNLASNLGLLCFNILLGIWLTPFFVHHLGDACYGMIPLITTMTGYMAVVTLGLNSAVGRYLTIAVENADYGTANQLFNTSLFGTLLLLLLLLLPLAGATMWVDYLIEIPAEQIVQVRWLFACAGAAFLLNTLMTPFAVSTYCLNRFELRNAVHFAQKLTYALIIIATFGLGAAELSSVGLAMACGAVVALCVAIWVWRVITPELRISISHFKLGTLNELASTSGWVSLNTIGAMLFLGVELIIVNHIFGPVTAGRYAAVMQWPILLRAVAATVSGVFGPPILYRFAQNDLNALVSYSSQAVKFMGLMMSLPVGLVCGLSVPLLATWLGPEYVDLALLLSLMTIHLGVNLSISPLFHVQIATNRVQWPGIVTLLMGIGNTGLALLLAGPAGWGIYGVAAATCIMLVAKNVIFTPLHVARAVRCGAATFYHVIIPSAIGCLALAAVGKFITLQCDVTGWVPLILVVGVMAAAYAFVAYRLLLTSSERDMLWQIVSMRKTGCDDKTAMDLGATDGSHSDCVRPRGQAPGGRFLSFSDAEADRLISTVVDGGYCVGCGACAAVENSPLQIHMNSNGQYTAAAKSSAKGTTSGTGLLAVCPFAGEGPNEDEIGAELFGDYCKYLDGLGYYCGVYAGHVASGTFRRNGSSGGMGTWLPMELFRRGMIDGVVHVSEAQRPCDGKPLFNYTISRSPQEIRRGAKSRYYPVEMSDVLQELRRRPGRYALVGLPCFIKAVRLLARQDQIIAERVRYCVALVCGHLKSARYADLLAWQCGVNPGDISSINFRYKFSHQPANAYGVAVKSCMAGEAELQVRTVSDLYGANWGHGFFKYMSCDYCDDVFGETADISIGDAWLPAYINDSQGNNVIVVRCQQLQKVIQSACASGDLHLHKLPTGNAIRTQDAGLRHRRAGLAYRLHLADENHAWRPVKRLKACQSHLNSKQQEIQRLRMLLSRKSHVAFETAVVERRFDVFSKIMDPYVREYDSLYKRPLWQRLAAKMKKIVFHNEESKR